MSAVPGLFNYWVAIFLMMAGFYVVIAQGNLVKKVVGLALFQASVFIFYISIGKVTGAHAPILIEGVSLYSNPLPQVLILTAIVVGVATTAVGLALVVRIQEAYGSVEEDDLQASDQAQAQSDEDSGGSGGNGNDGDDRDEGSHL
ncbi:MAG: cation:proton antiporter subunit C [Motiliproteus sp.]